MGEGSGLDALRERMSERSRAEVAGVAILLVVALGTAGLWWVRSSPKPVAVASPRPASATTASSASSSPAAATLFVHVAGAVRSPGVYRFTEGQRIVDAIEAAGGARRGAALDALNLAAPLVDGTQVLIPGPGVAVGVVGGGGLEVGGGSASGLLNINTATAAQFEALPGIGAVIAQRIVDFRDANGPFASIEGLLDVSGIGESTLGEIRDLVSV